MTDPVILYTRNLSIGYHEKIADPTVISTSIDLDLLRGSLTCLIGPNGAGKSTLIRTLIGLQKPLDGSIWLNGMELKNIPVQERSKTISIVLTEHPEMDQMSVYELVSLGRHPYTNWLGALNSQDHEIIQEALRLTNSLHLQDRLVRTLSDGERQKTMIARALAQEPDFLVLDEPTAFLDFPHRIDILHMLRNLAIQKSCAVLLSTHDLELAIDTADAILLMDQNGNLVVGAPEDMILSGKYDRAFNPSGKLAFDPMNASFHNITRKGPEISLAGENGILRHWTRHALERIGCTVTDTESLPLVHVHSGENDNWQWQFTARNNDEMNFTDIHSLISHIQKLS